MQQRWVKQFYPDQVTIRVEIKIDVRSHWNGALRFTGPDRTG